MRIGLFKIKNINKQQTILWYSVHVMLLKLFATYTDEK
jgi:hypothetical protein